MLEDASADGEHFEKAVFKCIQMFVNISLKRAGVELKPRSLPAPNPHRSHCRHRS